MDALPDDIRQKLLAWSMTESLDAVERLTEICFDLVNFLSMALKSAASSKMTNDNGWSDEIKTAFEHLKRCIKHTIFFIGTNTKNVTVTCKGSVLNIMAALLSSLFDVFFLQSQREPIDEEQFETEIGMCFYFLESSISHAMDAFLQCEYIDGSSADELTKMFLGKLRDLLKDDKMEPLEITRFLKGVLVYHEAGRMVGCGRKVEKSLKKVLLKRHCSQAEQTVNWIKDHCNSVFSAMESACNEGLVIDCLFNAEVMTKDNCEQLLTVISGRQRSANSTALVSDIEEVLRIEAEEGNGNGEVRLAQNEPNVTVQKSILSSEDFAMVIDQDTEPKESMPNEDTSSDDHQNSSKGQSSMAAPKSPRKSPRILPLSTPPKKDSVSPSKSATKRSSPKKLPAKSAVDPIDYNSSGEDTYSESATIAIGTKPCEVAVMDILERGTHTDDDENAKASGLLAAADPKEKEEGNVLPLQKEGPPSASKLARNALRDGEKTPERAKSQRTPSKSPEKALSKNGTDGEKMSGGLDGAKSPRKSRTPSQSPEKNLSKDQDEKAKKSPTKDQDQSIGIIVTRQFEAKSPEKRPGNDNPTVPVTRSVKKNTVSATNQTPEKETSNVEKPPMGKRTKPQPSSTKSRPPRLPKSTTKGAQSPRKAASPPRLPIEKSPSNEAVSPKKIPSPSRLANASKSPDQGQTLDAGKRTPSPNKVTSPNRSASNSEQKSPAKVSDQGQSLDGGSKADTLKRKPLKESLIPVPAKQRRKIINVEEAMNVVTTPRYNLRLRQKTPDRGNK